jgi:cell pole-organizing protein PopZ
MNDENGPGHHGEPSMEEILASIRRILKEDEIEDKREDSATAPEDEILILSAAMEAKPAESSAPEPAAAAPQTAPQTPPRNGTEMEQAMDDHVQSPSGLVSEAATAEITSALGPLVRGMSLERSAAVSRGGLSLEDIVREEMRPILKSWLDQHLPSLVERIVRAEIERVIDRTKP